MCAGRAAQRGASEESRPWSTDLSIQQTDPGQPKVCELQVTLGVDEQVVRLDVAIGLISLVRLMPANS